MKIILMEKLYSSELVLHVIGPILCYDNKYFGYQYITIRIIRCRIIATIRISQIMQGICSCLKLVRIYANYRVLDTRTAAAFLSYGHSFYALTCIISDKCNV